jgi:hypothetical protein
MNAELNNNDMVHNPDEKGVQIDNELSRLLAIKSEWEIDELRSKAPLVYETIFDNYDDDEENGITTDNFSFMESETLETFNLKAK